MPALPDQAAAAPEAGPVSTGDSGSGTAEEQNAHAPWHESESANQSTDGESLGGGRRQQEQEQEPQPRVSAFQSFADSLLSFAQQEQDAAPALVSPGAQQQQQQQQPSAHPSSGQPQQVRCIDYFKCILFQIN